MPKPTVGSRLSEARRLVPDLTATELSALAALKSPAHVGMIERGGVPNPSMAVLVKLADALGVSTDWLSRGAGKAPSARVVRAAISRARAARDARVEVA